MEIDNSYIISIVLFILSLGITLFISLIRYIFKSISTINEKLSEIHHTILKAEVNPNKFSEIKEEIVELKGMLSVLTFNQDRRKPLG